MNLSLLCLFGVVGVTLGAAPSYLKQVQDLVTALKALPEDGALDAKFSDKAQYPVVADRKNILNFLEALYRWHHALIPLSPHARKALGTLIYGTKSTLTVPSGARTPCMSLKDLKQRKATWLELFKDAPGPYWDITTYKTIDPLTVYTCNDFKPDDRTMEDALADADAESVEHFREDLVARQNLGIDACFPQNQYPELGRLRPMKQVENLLTHLSTKSSIDGELADFQKYPVIHKPALVHVLNNCIRLQLVRAVKLSPESKEVLHKLMLKPTAEDVAPCNRGIKKGDYGDWVERYKSSSNVLYNPQWVSLMENTKDLSDLYKFEDEADEIKLAQEVEAVKGHPGLQNGLGIGDTPRSPLRQVYELFKGLQGEKTLENFPIKEYPILHGDSPLKVECYYRLRFMIPLMTPESMTYFIEKLLPRRVPHAPPCMPDWHGSKLASWVSSLHAIGIVDDSKVKNRTQLIEARKKVLSCLTYTGDTGDTQCNIYQYSKDNAWSEELNDMLDKHDTAMRKQECQRPELEIAPPEVLPGSTRIIDHVLQLLDHLAGGGNVTDPGFEALHEEKNAPLIVEALRRLRVKVAAMKKAARKKIRDLPLFTKASHQTAAENAKGDFFERETFPLQKAMYDRWVTLLLDNSMDLWTRKDLAYAFPDHGDYATNTLVPTLVSEETLLQDINAASAAIYGDERPIAQAAAILKQLFEGATSFQDARTKAGNPKLFTDFVADDEGYARFAVMIEALRRLRGFTMTLKPDQAAYLADWIQTQRQTLNAFYDTKFVIPCMTGAQMGQKGLAGSFFDFLGRFNYTEQISLDDSVIGDARFRPYFAYRGADPTLAMYHPEHYLCNIFYLEDINGEHGLQLLYQGYYDGREKYKSQLPADYDSDHYPILITPPMVTVDKVIGDLYDKDDGSVDFKTKYTKDKYPLLYNSNLAPIFAECLRLQRVWVLEILQRDKTTSGARNFLAKLPLLSRQVPEELLYVDDVPGITDSKHLEVLHLWMAYIEEPKTLTQRLVATKFDDPAGVTPDSWYMKGFEYSGAHDKELEKLKKKIKAEDTKRATTARRAKTITDGDVVAKYQEVMKKLERRHKKVEELNKRIPGGLADLQSSLGTKLKVQSKANKKKVAAVNTARNDPNFKAWPKAKPAQDALKAKRADLVKDIKDRLAKLKAKIDGPTGIKTKFASLNKKRTDAIVALGKATARLDDVRKAFATTRTQSTRNAPKAKKAIEDAEKILDTLSKELSTQERNIRNTWRAPLKLTIELAEAEIPVQLAILDNGIKLYKLATKKAGRDEIYNKYVKPATTALNKAMDDLGKITKLKKTTEGDAFATELTKELAEIEKTRDLAQTHIKELEKLKKQGADLSKTIKAEEDQFNKFKTHVEKTVKSIKKEAKKATKTFKKVVKATLDTLGIQIMSEADQEALTKKKKKREKIGGKAARSITKARAKKRKTALKAAKATAAKEEAALRTIAMATGARESATRVRTGINYQSRPTGPERPGAGPGTVISKPVSTWKAEALSSINALRAQDSAHLAQLSSSDYQGMPFKGALKAEDMSRFPPTFLSAYTLADAGELDLNAIPVSAWRNFGEEVPSGPTHPAHLIDAKTLSELKIDIIRSLSPKFIANLEPSAMAGMKGPTFAALSENQLTGVSSAHVQNLEMSVWSTLTDQMVPRMGSNFAPTDSAHPRYQMDQAHLKAVPASTRKAIYKYWFNGSSMEYGRALYGWGIIGLFVAPFVF